MGLGALPSARGSGGGCDETRRPRSESVRFSSSQLSSSPCLYHLQHFTPLAFPLDLVSGADHSTSERRSAARTLNPHIKASRGGLDKAIRRCKAGLAGDHLERLSQWCQQRARLRLLDPLTSKRSRVLVYQQCCSRSVNLARG